MQRPGTKQERHGDEGVEGEGGRGDDDIGAVVVQGFVLGREGVRVPGRERGGGQLSQERKQGASCAYSAGCSARPNRAQ